MLKVVNILLIVCLLCCPYVCFGERTQGGCGDPFCSDSFGSVSNDVGKSANPNAGCCQKHAESQPQSVPHDRHPSPPPQSPNQCVCDGALPVADVRPMVLDLSHISAIDVGQATHEAGDAHDVSRIDVGNLQSEQIANCEICVRVCALLL